MVTKLYVCFHCCCIFGCVDNGKEKDCGICPVFLKKNQSCYFPFTAVEDWTKMCPRCKQLLNYEDDYWLQKEVRN